MTLETFSCLQRIFKLINLLINSFIYLFIYLDRNIWFSMRLIETKSC